MNQKQIYALTEMIPQRHSTRKYGRYPLPEVTMQKLRQFIEETRQSFPFLEGLTYEIKLCASEKLISFGSSNHAVFFSSPQPRDRAALGFLSELFVLYATSLGLNTCYLATYKRNSVCEVSGAGNRDFIIISPLGQGKSDFKTSLVKALLGKRKSVEAVTLPGSHPLPEDIHEACRLGTLAPSAVNVQNWRFFWDGASLQISSSPSKLGTADFNVGLCAAHVFLGLSQEATPPRVYLSEDQGLAVWTFTP